MHLSTRHIFAIAFILILFSIVIRQCEYFDPDVWWHLRTGQFILETRTIPHQDIFSFTRQGSPWVAHEWLTELGMFAGYKVAGWGLLVILFSLLTTAALWLAFLRCDQHGLLAGIATAVGCVAIFPVIGVRPQMVSLLMISVFLTLRDKYSASRKSRYLCAMLLLMVLWVNLHGAFPLGPGLIALSGAGLILDNIVQRRNRRGTLRRTLRGLLPLGLTFVGCLAVIPINPNGTRLFSYPFETLTSQPMQAYIQEWASPDFYQLSFQPLALMIMGVFTLVAVSPRRPRPSDILFLLVSCYATLRSARHMPFFVLVAIPILTRHASALIVPAALFGSRLFSARRRKMLVEGVRPRLALNVIFLALLMMAGAKQLFSVLRYRPLEEAQGLPVSAVEFMRKGNPPGPLYNSFNWGGYLIWTLPQYRVFIDGRPDMYGDQFFDEAIKTYRGLQTWKATLDRFGVQTVLIEPEGPLAVEMRADSAWRVIYEDRAAVIFSRSPVV